MSQVLERCGGLLASLERVRGAGLPSLGAERLDALRREALEGFLKTGLPGPKDEAWRLTNLAPIAEEPFSLPEKSAPVLEAQARAVLSVWLPNRIVFVDGFFSAELSAISQDKGVKIGVLTSLPSGETEFLEKFLRLAAEGRCGLSRLGAALFQDGVFLKTEPRVSLNGPLQIAFLWSAADAARMSHPLVAIEMGALSQAAVIEESAALGDAGASWRNRSAVINLSEGAQLDYCQIQTGGARRAFESTAGIVRQAKDSRFHSHVLTFGGDLVRNDFEAVLEGEGAECVLDGLYAANGSEHVDNHTLIRHAAPRCTSRELYKGVLGGQAQAAFRGIIEVAPAAQRTDAMVYNKNLLLSEKGWVNTKPEFRIFANDVQCKHGSTIGRLSEDALFYLRSRGIDAERAREFLIRAFAQEMLDSVQPESLRAALSRRLGAPAGDD
ncbi:MAG TPA: Fe-S cluster assembly protein SufD [Elusimicrobiota bacterium]|nr:Fe-S cluster assembly protein SufD [Elusimicrobiota bacterium]